MFKALNVYQLLAQINMPVDAIELGRTPELSRFHWQKEETWEWLAWADFCRRRLDVKKPGGANGTARLSMGKYLLDFAEWVREQLNSVKTLPPTPWDPTDRMRSWLLPYLRVSGVDELKALLDNDITLLRQAAEQD